MESKNQNRFTMTHVKFNNRPLAKSIDSLFDELIGNFPATWNNELKNLSFNSPAANIHETNEAYHLELIAPGRNKEDFKINIENGVLSIGFEKKDENKTEGYKTIRREFSYQSFKRSFNLDENVDTENIQAKYDNGVLKLLLPKKEQPKPSAKQINIQ
jgi:HSP20 family protein